MLKLPRVVGKIFARVAKNNGAFGSAVVGTGQIVEDNNIDAIQSYSAWKTGLADGLIGEGKMMAMEEIQGIFYSLFHELKYIMQQGIPEWHPLETYYVGSFCSYDGLIYFSLIDNNVGKIPPNFEELWMPTTAKKGGDGSGCPIGSIFAYAGKGTPEGYLPCNGNIVSRSEYADLFAAIGTMYNTGGESTSQFRIPNYNNEEVLLQSSTAAGTKIEAGMPNITGRFSQDVYSWGSTTGCFYGVDSGAISAIGGSTGILVELDARLGNSVYGTATTVQPKARTVVYLISF